jgi:hypothetical protein
MIDEPSTYVPPVMSETKFHTHIKQRVQLQFCVLDSKLEEQMILVSHKERTDRC